ncbi:MAG: uracil phosphoribosyltransferase [Gemmatimonadales bacterium]
MTHSDRFPNLTVVDHPLVQHKLAVLRNRATTTRDFRNLVNELGKLLAYEATQDLDLEDVTVETPLETLTAKQIAGKKLALVPILRAGLGMLDGVSDLVPNARIGHIGLFRDHDTLDPVDYYFKAPGSEEDRLFIVLDPMLATGGSMSRAVARLMECGARDIRALCLVAAPEGVARMLEDHPRVMIYTAALDRELDERGYILPGLGDAGDRLFGTK